METKAVEIQFWQQGGADEAMELARRTAEERNPGWTAGAVRWLWAEPGDRDAHGNMRRWVGVEVDLQCTHSVAA